MSILIFNAVNSLHVCSEFVAGGFALFVLTIYLYVQSAKDEAPELYHSNTPFTQYIISRVKRLREPYRPTPFLRNLHLQTVCSVILPRAKVDFSRELVWLDDGGVLALDWCDTHAHLLKHNSAIMIALPGMTGDKRSVSKLCLMAAETGLRAVVFNKRGLGNSPLATPKLQALGDPTDLRSAVMYIQEKYPSAKITGVGYSAGSGLLASYLGEYGKSSNIAAAVYISAGYKGFEVLEQIPHHYNYYLLRGLKQVVQQHSTVLSQVVDIPSALSAKTISEFDLEVYCKIYGYKNLEEYWKHNEPMRKVENLHSPGLCISSQDDPICVKNCIAFDMFDKFPNYILAYTKFGGHCGFLEGWKMEPWAVKLAVEYIQAVLEYAENEAKCCN